MPIARRDLLARAAIASAAAGLAGCGRSDAGVAAARAPAAGPLKPHPSNPRYFATPSGQAVFLTGAHTWSNLQEQTLPPGRQSFDWPAYLDMLVRHNHNFIRLWTWEQAAWAPWTPDKIVFEPSPYSRTGPGVALDGLLKFNLRQFHELYFQRLRRRVVDARDRGIYVSVMLFQGWSAKRIGICGDPWPGHPFAAANNINGIDGDRNRDSVLDLDAPAVRELHAAYLRKIVETVNDLDNVLYEVINEGGTPSWDTFVLDTLHQLQANKANRHPAGLTGAGNANLAAMLASRAEWISPGGNDNPAFKTDPPAWNGPKVCVLDTDHIWGLGGSVSWAWKSLTRGYNTLFMDPWQPVAGALCADFPWNRRPGSPDRNLNNPQDPLWPLMRRAIGNTRTLALRADLAAMTPQPDITSTGYCLANPGREYLVYAPEGDEITIELPAAYGSFSLEWMHPVDGSIAPGGTLPGGARRLLAVPFPGPAALYIRNTTPRALWPLERRPRK